MVTDPSLRDRLIEACEPWDLPDGASIESSVVRNAHEIADAVLAVIVDALRNPDEALTQEVSDAIAQAPCDRFYDGHRANTCPTSLAALTAVADVLAGGSDV